MEERLHPAKPVKEASDATRERPHRCAACGAPLFQPEAELDAGTGFPTYRAPVSREQVALEERRSHGQPRTVVRCAACDARLGHRFEDGPRRAGARYCIRRNAIT